MKQRDNRAINLRDIDKKVISFDPWQDKRMRIVSFFIYITLLLLVIYLVLTKTQKVSRLC